MSLFAMLRPLRQRLLDVAGLSVAEANRLVLAVCFAFLCQFLAKRCYAGLFGPTCENVFRVFQRRKKQKLRDLPSHDADPTSTTSCFSSIEKLFKRDKNANKTDKNLHPGTQKPFGEVCPCLHNVNRQAMIAFAGPVDHSGHVLILPDETFDIHDTIFKELKKVPKTFMSAKIGCRPHWNESRVVEVAQECEKRVLAAKMSPQPPPVSSMTAIYDFMFNRCDFSMEHADGSFLDHLDFCRDFSAVHLPQHSPRILFLHSICGVGTNVWPMGKELLPELEKLVDSQEFKHIEAFPTVLRLLKGTDFLNELFTHAVLKEEKDSLIGVSFTRLLDGKRIDWTLDDLWLHLNFHLIHSLDFLPIAGWKVNWNDTFLQEFGELYVLLVLANRLTAKICPPPELLFDGSIKGKDAILTSLRGQKNVDLRSLYTFEGQSKSSLFPMMSPPQDISDLSGLPNTYLNSMGRCLPAQVTRYLGWKSIRDFSAAAGVSLDYTWKFSEKKRQ